MSEYIHKSHNVSVLLYHLVFPAKYRCAVFDESVDEVFRNICMDIENRYEVKFIEIDGYFASTVGKHGDEKMIKKYVKNQGKEYMQLHRNDQQLQLF